MDIKQYLKKRRKELHLTMDDVAKMVGVSESTISRWESGAISNMTRSNISALAKALQISPSIIMGWTEEESSPGAEEKTPRERKYDEIISLLEALPEEKVTEAIRYLKYLADN